MKNLLKRGRSLIHSALLKYGHNNFKLEILEFCDKELLIEREDHYIKLLNPEYNLCPKAGSTLGKLHSESTKEKIRNSLKGKKRSFFADKHHTLETKEKIRNSLLNRIFPEMSIETKLKLSLNSIGIKVKVYDIFNTFIREFPTVTSTAKYFKISTKAIQRSIKSDIPFQNFLFKPEVTDNRI
jgi:group I intron endonuclease